MWHGVVEMMQQAAFSFLDDNNNNNNNSHDNVYGAVIMTKVIARVRPVHLMNVDWAPGGRQPSDQASRLGLWVCHDVHYEQTLAKYLLRCYSV